MKKSIKIFLIILMLISFATIVNAADVTMSLKPEKEKIEQGSEIKVQLIIKDFGRTGNMNALEGKIVYETEKLNYKKIEYKNNWGGQVTEDGTGMTLNKSGTIEKDEVVAEITYEVKETAELGKTKVALTNINTSTDGDEIEVNNIETEMEIVKKEEQIPPDAGEKTLTSIEITNLPTKTTYTEGEKFSTAGMKVTAKYSDGTSKEITNYTFSPNDTLKTTDKTKIEVSAAGVYAIKAEETGFTYKTATRTNRLKTKFLLIQLIFFSSSGLSLLLYLVSTLMLYLYAVL